MKNFKSFLKISILIILVNVYHYARASQYQYPNTQYDADKNIPFLKDVIDVKPQTGALVISEADIKLPGRAGLDLEIRRIYSSSLSNLYNMGFSLGRNYISGNTHLDKKYGLGSGWGFSFPSLQKDIDIQGQINLYLGNGQVYSIFFTEDPGDSNIEYYKLKDIRFEENTSYSYQGQVSKYALIRKDQTKYFFDEHGNLLAIKHKSGRPGLIIRFIYEQMEPDARIMKIIDTCGREVIFAYAQNGLLQQISWGSKVIKYKHRIFNSEPILFKFGLAEVEDPMGRITRYHYPGQLPEGFFSFLGEMDVCSNTFASLVRIERDFQPNDGRTSSKSEYVYEKASKFFFDNLMEFYRVINRKDININGQIFNNIDFQYTGQAYMSEGNEYSCQATYDNGRTEIFCYDTSDHVCVRKDKRFISAGLRHQILTEYDEFTDYPKKESFFVGSNLKKVRHTEFNYNEYGDLLWESKKSALDTDWQETVYQYDENFHLMTYKEEKNFDLDHQDISCRTRWVIDEQTGDILEVRLEHEGSLISYERNLYDQYGNIIEKKDALWTEEYPEFHVEKREYDEKFHAYPTRIYRMIKNIDGEVQTHEIKYTYYDNGLKESETNARGHTTCYEYDLNDRMTKKLEPDGFFWGYEYDDPNAKKIIRDKLQHQTIEYYDGLEHLLIKKELLIEDRFQDGKDFTYTIYTYDSSGNNTGVENARGKITRFEYDAFDRLVKTIFPDQTSSEIIYQDEQLKKINKNANGHITEYVLDWMDRIKYIYEHNGETIYITEYIYDQLNKRIKIIDALGRETKFNFNDLQQLVKKVYPNGKTISYDYDDLGNRIYQLDRKDQEGHYKYDELNRLIEERYIDYKNEEIYEEWNRYWYDKNGNIIKQQNRDVSYENIYDQLDNMTQQEMTIDGQTYTTEYQYDEMGNCTGIKRPGDTGWLEYKYNEMHWLKEISGYAVFEYYPTGDPLCTTFYNGLQTKYILDDRNRPSKLITPDILELHYEFDGENNVLTENQNTFTYDDLERLETAILWNQDMENKEDSIELIRQSFGMYFNESGYLANADINQDGRVDGFDLLNVATTYRPPGVQLKYTYDAVGNRLLLEKEDVTISYNYDPHCDRLLSVEEPDRRIEYSYDLNGNLIRRREEFPMEGRIRINNFVFDAQDRLIKVYQNNDPNQILAEYKYNPMGLRIQKKSADIVTTYVYDQWKQVLYEIDREAQKKTGFVNHVMYHVAMENDQGVFFFHQDVLLSTRVMSDMMGNKVWWRDYYPFGGDFNSGSTNSEEQKYCYTGKEKDIETDLYYYGARFYDPATGRFISEDMADPDYTLPQSFNRYVYCMNNPLKYIDPDGEVWWMVIVKVVQAIVKVVQTVSKLFKAISKTVSQIKKSINPLNYIFKDSDKDMLKTFKEKMDEAWDPFKQGSVNIMDMTEDLSQQMKILGDQFKDIGSTLGSWMKDEFIDRVESVPLFNLNNKTEQTTATSSTVPMGPINPKDLEKGYYISSDPYSFMGYGLVPAFTGYGLVPGR